MIVGADDVLNAGEEAEIVEGDADTSAELAGCCGSQASSGLRRNAGLLPLEEPKALLDNVELLPLEEPKALLKNVELLLLEELTVLLNNDGMVEPVVNEVEGTAEDEEEAAALEHGSQAASGVIENVEVPLVLLRLLVKSDGEVLLKEKGVREEALGAGAEEMKEEGAAPKREGEVLLKEKGLREEAVGAGAEEMKEEGAPPKREGEAEDALELPKGTNPKEEEDEDGVEGMGAKRELVDVAVGNPGMAAKAANGGLAAVAVHGERARSLQGAAAEAVACCAWAAAMLPSHSPQSAISTDFDGCPLALPHSPAFRTISIPSITLPNAAYFPSKWGQGARQMKNWAIWVLGLPRLNWLRMPERPEAERCIPVRPNQGKD